jgi:hypothetical protein
MPVQDWLFWISFEEERSQVFSIDSGDLIKNANIFGIISNYIWVSSIGDLHNNRSDSNQKQVEVLTIQQLGWGTLD